MRSFRYLFGMSWLLLWGLAVVSAKDSPVREVRIQDISTVEGVRDNSLVGYGMVVGLNGTGDRQQTLFPAQTLLSILQKMGVQVTGTLTSMQVRNIAAVFITATLPPFPVPGRELMSMSHPLATPRAWKAGFCCSVHSTRLMAKPTRPRRALSCLVGTRQAFA